MFNLNKAKKQQHAAFTLIESLVAVSLFVLVISSALGLFLTYSKAQKETGLRQKIINQLSYELEKIARDIRVTKIEFSPTASAGYKTGSLYNDGDSGISGKEIDLGLTTGTRYFFWAEDAPNSSLSCFGKLNNEDTGYLYRYTSTNMCEPVFMISEIKLIDVGFYISPSYNPYSALSSDCKNGTYDGYYCSCVINSDCHSGICSEGFCYVSQPSVTISVTAQIGSDTANKVTLQTTVSSRVYQ